MKITHTQTILAAALTYAVASVAASAQAQDATAAEMTPAAASESAPWQFGVTVPLWAAGIDGNATVNGKQQDVNISFNQLKDHLDASFALGLEARKGKLGFFGSFGYMKFSADATDGSGNHASDELKFVMADAGVSYQLIKTESEHPFVLEGTLGLRYWYTDNSLTIKDSTGTVLLSGGTDRNLEDPMVGLRGSQFLTRKLHLDFAGDIGGFGLTDNQAELDWSATGVVTYDFAKWFSLSAGYKAVALDASNGSGAGKNGVNIIMNGALIAAKFKF